eukprot:86963-Prorocentrum_minimum.AAC.1
MQRAVKTFVNRFIYASTEGSFCVTPGFIKIPSLPPGPALARPWPRAHAIVATRGAHRLQAGAARPPGIALAFLGDRVEAT